MAAYTYHCAYKISKSINVMKASGLLFISSDKIDKPKWDRLVEHSNNASIFCYSWYLDSFCNWNAIVLGDYKGAIAIPVKKNWGFTAVFQPPFIQKCEWFGKNIDQKQKEFCITTVNQGASIINFNSNIDWLKEDKPRTNLTLSLDHYDKIHAGYSKSLAKNINKNKQNIEVIDADQIGNAIELYKKAYGALNPHLDQAAYDSLTLMADKKQAHFICKEVYQNGALIAALLFAYGKGSLHYILGAPTSIGRKHNAISVALDSVIQQYSNRNLKLDFEGSSIPSVKDFYESFGAQNEPFYEIEATKSWILGMKKIYKRVFRS
jgi:hypothetical protein